MKHLVIAEKPSVGRDIARVLHCAQKKSSYIEGDQYIVTWAMGHLVSLADPEAYGDSYKSWNLETLPMLPQNWKLTIIRQTSKQYHCIKELLYRKDVSDIIIATDAGREGELVARWILDKAGCKKPVQRLWISSVTDKAIKEGFSHLKPGAAYQDLYKAAVARAKADWVVGINATRALTCRHNAQLSCGRVQTPTLSMIAAREQEIRAFQPVSYYGLKATVNGITFSWIDKDSSSSRSYDQKKIQSLYNTLSQKSMTISNIQKRAKKSFSPLLYDLTTLQKEANQRYGFSAKQTLNIMQRLYETHKVLTYPRTDSRYLTLDIVDTLKERLQACAVGPYRKFARRLSMQKIQSSPSFVNDTKVSDHHAIIPTEQYVSLEQMTTDERKIYDLVVRRFLAILSPACEYEEISIEATLGCEHFISKNNVITNYGWKEIYDTSSQDSCEGEILFCNSKLPSFEVGSTLCVSSLSISEGKTKPPSYFTEGTLIAAMENPIKYMQDKDRHLAKTLGETGGIGTVATRADIIDKLFHSFLMEKKGNEIHITSKGKQLLELVPKDLKTPELTAYWEQRLIGISKGKESDTAFLSEIESYTKKIVQEIKSSSSQFRHENMSRTKCPQCGKHMLEVNGKHGKLLVCQDRECGYRETLSRHTNARCPICHKKMDLIGKGDSQRFICSCGHKEKLSVFQARKSNRSKGASKKDVNQYLKQQAKEASTPINNAFADAFSKLSLE